jgi:uncharacterized protein (DUF2249 family)/quercetin dioxygenase-like cupin family protein
MRQPTTPTDTHPTAGDSEELDVRAVPKPQRHPLIFGRFDSLAVGESFILVNSHDPRHLHDEFERDHPGTYEWTYLPTGDRKLWRIKITRRVGSDLPRVLVDTSTLPATPEPDSGGAVWRLEPTARQLDANLIRLAPDGQIEAHLGPDLDVLLHVLGGSGQITTATDPIRVRPGVLVWLPRRSQRAVLAGPDGLTYLSVHPRRPGLSIATAARSTAVSGHGH